MSQEDWHCIEVDEALRHLNVSANGLTMSEAQRRLGEHGPNAIPETRHRSLLAMLLGQFTDFMIIVRG